MSLEEEYGEDWVLDRVPHREPAMPNRTPLEVELVIVDYALTHPEAGPRTIVAALRTEHGVGPSAVYGTSKRRGLESRAKRLEEVRRRAGDILPDEVERDRALSKQRAIRDTGAGVSRMRRHQPAARAQGGWPRTSSRRHDGHSSYGTAVLAPARNGEMAAAAMERPHGELSAVRVADIGRALTNNGTEFVVRPTHPFEALCARLVVWKAPPFLGGYFQTTKLL